jgi:Beta-1,3-glucanase/PEP-CTERM motif
MTEKTLAAIVVSGLFASTPASADLILDFKDSQPLAAYVTFAGGGAFDATATIDGVTQKLLLGKSYQLTDLSGGVDVTEYDSGRVFVSLGSPLTGLSPSNNYAPNFVAPQLNPNFLTRFDKYEINYVTKNAVTSGGANLSSADFFGIPLELTSTGGQQPKTLTWNTSTKTAFTNLGRLANFSTDTIDNASGALVVDKTGNSGVNITTDSGQTLNVVRVIAPGSVNQGANGSTPFPSLSSYLTYLQTGGPGSTPITANIAGANGQPTAGGAFQNYNFTAYISNMTKTFTTKDGTLTANPGDLVIDGDVDLGDDTGHETAITILVTKADLTDFVVYGANPTYSSIGGDTNGIIEKVIADYFAGLNFGFIGSQELNPTTNPTWNGKEIGESPSWTWYGNIPDGGPLDPLPLSDAYAAAQPNPDTPYYNQYAAYLNNSSTPVTDSYGFPYTDRLASPLAALDPDTTLLLTILSDTPGLGVPAPIPEPSTWVMMGLGFAGLAFAGYRAKRKTAVAA